MWGTVARERLHANTLVRRFVAISGARHAPPVIGVLASVGMAVRLFLPTPVAMADNNDGSRLLCLVGAETGNPKWVYAVFRYPASGQHTGCRGYPTLTAVQIRATAWLHRHLLGLSGVIDMRELMVEYCVLVGIVFAATAWLLAGFRTLPRLAFLGALFGLPHGSAAPEVRWSQEPESVGDLVAVARAA
jgi:hypothetical protein